MVVLVCGCSDSAPPTPLSPFPEHSVQAMTEFIDSRAYRADTWRAETAVPRSSSTTVSPHGRVQVWMNEILVASQAAGNGKSGGTAHQVGSMAVKEFYDTDDALLGQAAIRKLPGSRDQWAYFCNADPLQCGLIQATSEVPLYGVGTETECGFCHGGFVFTQMPPL